MKICNLIYIAIVFIASFTSINAKQSETTLIEKTLENTSADLIEYCKVVPCRKNTYFKVKLKDGSYYEYKGLLDPPIIQPEFITLYPGEEALVEVTVNENNIIDLKLVSEIVYPEKTITMKFWQEPSIGDGTQMMLKVQNPFEQVLKYKLGIMTFDSDQLVYTSSCPVRPGLSVFEHWPYPIFQIAFSDLKFISIQSDAIECK